MTSKPLSEKRIDSLTTVILAVGALLTVAYWSRSQVAGDQLNMLARGWLLAVDGEWIPFGLGTSAGGKSPGGFTSFIVGLPLWIWQHHRAPTLVMPVLSLLAYLLLDRIVSRELGPAGRLLFAIVYWLNPWRLYHSGFLWNSSYLMPLGALHFWSIYRQRELPSFWASFWQVLAIGLALQLHASAATLVILSLMLWWRGYFRFHWPGVALAVTVIALSLIPWLHAVAMDPSLMPRSASHHGRLAQSFLSMTRGLGYWLRFPALIGSSTILCLDFAFLPRSLAGDSLRQGVQIVVGLVTLPAVVWANLHLWRGNPSWWRRGAIPRDFKTWLLGVLRWSFVGIILVCAITPTAVMSWQLLNVFHLSVLPLVLLGLHFLDTGRQRLTMIGASTYLTLCLFLAVAIGGGSPMFRCGGETCDSMNATPPPLRSDHEMLDELGIQETCGYQIDVPGGWWPDVLPEK